MRLHQIAVSLLAGLMTTAAYGTTIEVIGYDSTAGLQVGLLVDGIERSEYAAPLQIRVDGGEIIDVFCVDFFTGIGYTTYTVDINPSTPGIFEDAGRMYSTHVADMKSSTGVDRQVYGAALQIALWEVMTDGYDPGNANALSTGRFQQSATNPFSNANPALEGIVNSYLTSILGPVGPGVIVYTSSDKDFPIQALLGDGNPVPEPSSLLLIGVALVGLGIRRRS